MYNNIPTNLARLTVLFVKTGYKKLTLTSAHYKPISLIPGRRWTEVDEESECSGVVRSDSTSSSTTSEQSECPEEFRARASTDSRLPPRPARPRHPPPARHPPPGRRMSVAMRGNNASTYWILKTFKSLVRIRVRCDHVEGFLRVRIFEQSLLIFFATSLAWLI